MSEAFEKFVTGLHRTSEKDVDIALSQENAKWAKEGALSNSRRWLYIQEILFKHVQTFGEDLEDRLVKYDLEHSPINKEDFDLSTEAVKTFSIKCAAKYKAMCERNAPWPGSPIPFNNEEMKAVVDGLTNDLGMQKKVFSSQRSILKKVRKIFFEKWWAWLIALLFSFLLILKTPVLNLMKMFLNNLIS